MKLELYYRKTCPYCRKVLQFMEKEGLSIETLKDLSEKDAYIEELESIGGKKQVPCLVKIEGNDKKTALYESDDIISWIDCNRKFV